MKTILKILSISLEKFCDFTHKLPYEYDERLQNLFFKIFGYRCPFAIWSYRLDKRFNLGIWN
jgi:hypothetical protein